MKKRMKDRYKFIYNPYRNIQFFCKKHNIELKDFRDEFHKYCFYKKIDFKMTKIIIHFKWMTEQKQEETWKIINNQRKILTQFMWIYINKKRTWII